MSRRMISAMFFPGHPEKPQEILDTKLHQAAYDDDPDGVRYLIRAGANKNAVLHCFYGTTPLHVASLLGHVKAAMALMEEGADISPVSGHAPHPGTTPLHMAAIAGHLGILIKLLEHGANPSEPTLGHNTPTEAVWGTTALHFAAGGGRKEIVAELLARGAFPSSRNLRRTTPLHDAVAGGHTEVVKLLLKGGANPNAKDIYGKTPLHIAAEQMKKGGGTDIITALAAAGADSVVHDNDGKLPEDGLDARAIKDFRAAFKAVGVIGANRPRPPRNFRAPAPSL